MRSIDRIYQQLNARNQVQNLERERHARFDKLDHSQKTSFKDILTDALSEVDSLQKSADDIVFDFSEGKVENVHDVMVALEKADVGLKLAVEVRNRLMDAYRELMNLRF